MFEQQSRAYNRIFTGTNQTGGYENIYLGYNSNVTSLKLTRDNTTTFHIPTSSTVSSILNSTLIPEGAVAGALPAGSDRILKSQTSYGNNTPYGTSTGLQNGTWLCSWLYAASGTQPLWQDRYYNPDRLTLQDAFYGEYTPNITNESLFVDIQSEMSLDPGVMYEYFHFGEKSAQQIVDTFSGNNNDRASLLIKKYDSKLIDSSIYGNNGIIQNYKDTWSKYNTNTDYVSCNYLDFNNSDLIVAKINYDSSYNTVSAFTINTVIGHTDWSNAQSTQLVGNYFYGGVGLFYNNLRYYPYFAIAENTYGNLLFFNPELNAYRSQNTVVANYSQIKSNPKQVCLNGEREIFIVNNLTYTANNHDNTCGIFKYNYSGDIITEFIFDTNVDVLQIAIDHDNNVIAFTDTNTGYVLDSNLNQLSTFNTTLSSNDKAIFDLNGNIQQIANCIDAIYDNNNNLWVIDLSGSVTYNNTTLENAPVSSTNLTVDPHGNVWVLYGVNQVAVYDAEFLTPINNFNIGSLICGPTTKNISFINIYDRQTNSFYWRSLVYLNADQTLYTTTLDGVIDQTIRLDALVNLDTKITTDVPNAAYTSFVATGDFTGYEWSRLNNNLIYQNKPQIQFKLTTSTTDITIPANSNILSIPVDYFNNDNWYNVTAVYGNHNMSLYVNGYFVNQLTIPNDEDAVNIRNNNFFIGTPNGKTSNLNLELNTESLTYNGQISDISIYNYAIESRFIPYFTQAITVGEDLIWSAPTEELQYIETIERFFKNKIPGSKSQFFKIKISNTQITDPNTRALVENYIRAVITQTKPAYTELIAIEWV
jgi:hypothetical protein